MESFQNDYSIIIQIHYPQIFKQNSNRIQINDIIYKYMGEDFLFTVKFFFDCFPLLISRGRRKLRQHFRQLFRVMLTLNRIVIHKCDSRYIILSRVILRQQIRRRRRCRRSAKLPTLPSIITIIAVAAAATSRCWEYRLAGGGVDIDRSCAPAGRY